MATTPAPRVRFPAQAKPGEIIEIKTLIAHDMESGFRKDAAGQIIPRKIIKKFTAAFNGKTVFEADWNPAISANPFQSFFYKAAEPGEFAFVWKDDDGSEYSTKAKLAVA